MNYAGIKYCDIANGLGCRTVLFVSGCRNHCKGCFQPQTWEFDYGEPFDEQIQNEIDELNDLESEPAEIYEWWIVTNWLAEKLEIQGQCILEYANMHFWGRQTTGQAILLDGVISRICEGMEILEGQPNEWKNV